MPTPTYRSPFPRLALAAASASDLRRLAHGLVSDAVDDYEHFLWRQHSTIDPVHWSLDREKDEVRVYHNKAKPTKVQELLLVGTLLGELDDAMYGIVSPTTDSIRLQAAATADRRFHDGAVLATLQTPTRATPFRLMTLEWVVHGHGGPLHLPHKKIDMVVVNATGMTTLSNGETVGFQLRHSVELGETPTLAKYDRVSLSVCTLWRQKTDARVQLYARAFVSARDTAVATRAVKRVSDTLLARARSIACAQSKKLAWLMRCKSAILGDRVAASRSLTGSRDLSGVSRSSASSSSFADGCEICPTQLIQNGPRRSAKAVCLVCNRLVCSSCRVKRALHTITADARMLDERVAFCAPCHTIALRAAASDVASEDVARFTSAREENHFVSDDESEAGNVSHNRGGEAEEEPSYNQRFSFRKAKPTSSRGGTLEDDDMDWSPAARHRAGAELQALYILGDA